MKPTNTDIIQVKIQTGLIDLLQIMYYKSWVRGWDSAKVRDFVSNERYLELFTEDQQDMNFLCEEIAELVVNLVKKGQIDKVNLTYKANKLLSTKYGRQRSKDESISQSYK